MSENSKDVLNCDIAWVGGEPTTLSHIRNGRAHVTIRLHDMRFDDVAEKIVQWLKDYPHGLVQIKSGVAESSIVDRLLHAGYRDNLLCL